MKRIKTDICKHIDFRMLRIKLKFLFLTGIGYRAKQSIIIIQKNWLNIGDTSSF